MMKGNFHSDFEYDQSELNHFKITTIHEITEYIFEQIVILNALTMFCL